MCLSQGTRVTHRLTLEVVSTVEEVMAVEASLMVVLDSCSPTGLDIMEAPCGLEKSAQQLYQLIKVLYIFIFPLHDSLLLWKTR